VSVKTQTFGPCFSSGYAIVKYDRLTGIGLIMATTLENNGATVYIVGRRFDVVKKAAKENNVCFPLDLRADRRFVLIVSRNLVI